jgi:serine/threonine protein kinase/tetratricopeptide (TPR) repeat protein
MNTAPGGLLGGRYEIIRELGRGGMGVVYACVDRVTGARVALKRVDRPGRAVAAGDTFWFHQEARALASLEHPAIVRARDFGVLEDGSPYLVMELVAGRSLHQVLEAGTPPWSVTWSIIDQVLAALAHAHARGVIHGDLKPQNLILEPSGPVILEPRVHVLDFGLAFLLTDRHDPRLDGVTTSKPAMPYGGGTPGFMAPEQIRRAVPHVGPPTDLYALGCMLYQMLSGRPPYVAMRDGANGPEVDEEMLLKLHKSAPVPTPLLEKDVPAEVAPLVVRMLAKRPWRRFDFAGDLRNRWEKVRPTGTMSGRSEEDDDSPYGVRPTTTAPDTRVDVLTIAATNLEPITPTQGPPELLGLRPIPMVGRGNERTELYRLADLLATPDGPRHRMSLVLGEAGVGKSRLAEWICERVHERAAMVPLRARYRRVNGPLDGLNGAVLAHYGLERVDRILVEQALINTWEIEKDDEDGMTWVAATAEWLRPSSFAAEVTSANAGERRSRERSNVGPTGKRFTLDEPELRWLVIKRVLERIGRDRPVLLWLDDFHNAPPNTFEGLAKIRRESPTLRTLLIATVRHEALVGDPQLERRLESLRRTFGGPRLPLSPLDPADTHALLRSALPLDDRALREAEARSKGNPLFALQLLHAWAATGGLELVGAQYRVRDDALTGRVTTTAELWDERLLALEPPHRAAAEAASALGAEFRGDVLRRLVAFVVGLGGFGIDVTRAVDALQRAHILVATSEDRFKFPHALLQEHLLFRLSQRDDAREVFRAAADALSIHPLAGTRRVVRHRVLNLLRAGDADAAAELLLRYVEQAWSRVRDASRTLEDLALLDVRRLDVAARKPSDVDADTSGAIDISRLPDLAPPALSPRWAASHLRWRAEALRHAGRFDDAKEAAQKARKTFLSLGDERNEGHCLRLLGHIASEQGDPNEGRKLVARALAVFDRVEDEQGRAQCEVVIGELDYLIGDHVSARDELHRGARRFKAIGDQLGRAQCLLLIGLIELAEGLLPKSRDLLLEARNEFDGMGYRLGISQVDVALAHVEHRAGDLEGARARALATRDTLRALENPRGTAGAERLLAMIAIDQEDGGDAKKHGRAALDLYEKLGDPWGILESRLLLVQESLLRGAIAEAALEMRACEAIEIDEAEPLQHRHLTRAWLASQKKDWKEAASAIGEAQRVFPDRRRMGDHAQQLIVRFDVQRWKDPAGAKVREWCESIGGLRGTGQFPQVH